MNIAAFGRPDHPTDEADIADALRAHDKVLLSLVAEVDGMVVGHVMFSPATITYDSGEVITQAALGPIGVVPRLQRRGIGSALVRSGLDECRQLGFRGVILYGAPDYYSRFGFVPAGLFGIIPPGPPRIIDAFQAIELEPGALAGITGVAREAEELA